MVVGVLGRTAEGLNWIGEMKGGQEVVNTLLPVIFSAVYAAAAAGEIFK